MKQHFETTYFDFTAFRNMLNKVFMRVHYFQTFVVQTLYFLLKYIKFLKNFHCDKFLLVYLNLWFYLQSLFLISYWNKLFYSIIITIKSFFNYNFKTSNFRKSHSTKFNENCFVSAKLVFWQFKKHTSYTGHR